jgi:putative membrane protein
MAKKHPVRGLLAGVAGGLVASWAMNVWSEGPGATISQELETPEEQQKLKSSGDGEDATMKTADALATVVHGGQHLTRAQREEGGPIVHYAFGALMGGVYGLLAEYLPVVHSGFGTTYGTALFVGVDLVAVPALGLSQPLSAYPAGSYAGPFTAHLVYGATTELVRRLARVVL